MKRVFLSLLAACIFAGTTTGCWGSFALTKKAYDFNNKFWGNKWISWIAYLILGSLVVGVTMFVDSLILNSLEFWTGSNPVALGDTYHETDANGNSVTAVKMEDGSLYMRLDTQNGESQELVLQRDEEIIRILDTKGNVIREAAYAE
ncbi:MAG: DUF3332 domain-containing protein [Candidatus Fibromonas sp.]|jgi:hypothetical protein|nr:DUF3332 domain-containing protein [Candidatus Fibromonas sp.]